MVEHLLEILASEETATMVHVHVCFSQLSCFVSCRLQMLQRVRGDYWGDWSPWSECSRTCDGGATYQERKCIRSYHSRQGCEGDRYRYSTCNTNVRTLSVCLPVSLSLSRFLTLFFRSEFCLTGPFKSLSLSPLSLSLSLMKISSSPYIIFCGRRGVEHELTNFLCLSLHLSVCPFLRLSLCYIYT